MINELCKCLPPEMESLVKAEPCNLYQHMTCLKSAYLQFQKIRFTKCKCQEKCNRTDYKTLDIQYGYHWLENDMMQRKSQIISFRIQVDNVQRSIQTVPEYPLSRFLSDVGGSFGLFLGISIASIVGYTEKFVRGLRKFIISKVRVETPGGEARSLNFNPGQ